MPIKKKYKNRKEIFNDLNRVITEDELVIYVSYKFPYKSRQEIINDYNTGNVISSN